MIYFLTDKTFQSSQQIEVVNHYEALKIVKRIYEPDEVCIDTETNGLDAYKNQILLTAIGNADIQLVIDNTDYDLLRVLPNNYAEKLYIGHNLKYDYKMLKVQQGIILKRLYDTMVVEQKIYQGALYNKKTRPLGIRTGLDKVLNRRFGIIGIDKDIRNEFVGVHPNQFIPVERHIIYNAGDLKHLQRLKEAQKKDTQLFQFYIDNIVNDVLIPTAEMELEGWDLDTIQWEKNIKFNKDEAFNYACKLDETLLELRDKYLQGEERLTLVGYEYTRKRIKQEKPIALSMFEDVEVSDTDIYGKSKKYVANKGNINWNSSDQLIEIFAKLKFELPVDLKAKAGNGFNPDRGTPYATPKLVKGRNGYKVEKGIYAFTTAKTAIEEFQIERPDNPAQPLLKNLITYRQHLHAIDSFGANYYDFINPITGRIHSFYRTESSETGRYQSGDTDNGYFNNQQIPRNKLYRQPFYRKGYRICTSDLSGAEVTIICDKAHDMQLYEWAVKNDDAHSPIATACWRNVYLFRAGKLAGYWYDEKSFFAQKDSKVIHFALANEHTQVKELYNLSQEYIISKEINKDKRQQFKNNTFGTVYGMGDKKCGKTLNIPVVEARIVLETIKSAIPDTFKYVESNVQFAFDNGYLQLNDRSGSRILFPEQIKYLQGKRDELSFNEMREIDGSARNAPIQGTQADMLKEAMIMLYQHIKFNNVDAAILAMVHDELVVRFPHEYDDDKEQKVLFFNGHIPKNLIIKGKTVKEYFPLIDNGLAQLISVPKMVEQCMITAANYYLKHFKMKAEYQVADTWIK